MKCSQRPKALEIRIHEGIKIKMGSRKKGEEKISVAHNTVLALEKLSHILF